MAKNNHFDFFVIGGGSAGVRAARIAAQQGAKTGIAEGKDWGGTCVNLGCVPKKLMVHAGEFSHAFTDAQGYGWQFNAHPHFHWPTLLANKNQEIERLNSVYNKLLREAGCHIFEDYAQFIDPHHVMVGKEKISAEKFLIATGGIPFLPDIEGAKAHGLISDDIFYLQEQPRSIAIIGGGYIAVEFAGIFANLGTRVDLLYRGDRLLRGFDAVLGEELESALCRQGVTLHRSTDLSAIHKSENALHLDIQEGKAITVETCLFATGRKPQIANLQLDKAGVLYDQSGAIIVDDNDATNQQHIFAVGDVTDRLNLTPVAIAQGHALALRLFGVQSKKTADLSDVPTAVFSSPQIATVGLSEEAAKKAGYQVQIYQSRFQALVQMLSSRREYCLIKLVVEEASQRVLGCHMIGPHASEIMQGLAVAMKAGATKEDFDRTIGIHPTIAEEFVTLRSPRE